MTEFRIVACVACLLWTLPVSADDFPTFEHVVIDNEAADKAVYAVTLADVNGFVADRALTDLADLTVVTIGPERLNFTSSPTPV